MEYTLRHYQKSAISNIHKEYKSGINKQLVVMATGLGKTIISLFLASKFADRRVLFMVHREEIINQTFHKYESQFPMQVGIIKGSRYDIDKRFIIASVQTLYNRKEKINPDHFNLIIIDEAHHYQSTTYSATANYFNPQLLIGLTATPKRFDGLSLLNIFQKVVFDYPIIPAIKTGDLCPIEAFKVSTAVDLTGIKKTAGDLNQLELANKINTPERNKIIVAKYKQYGENKPCIVFAIDVKHCMDLAQAFTEAGYLTSFVVSDESIVSDREDRIKRFKSGEIQIMVNVMILTEGFDYPDVGCIIQARPTLSETVYVQQLGRGTRLKSDSFKQKYGNDYCVVIDVVDNTSKHELINTAKLEEGLSLKDKVFLNTEAKEKLLSKQEERERKMQEIVKDTRVSLMELPKVVFNNSAKMNEPATEKQLDWLKREGVYQEGMAYTKLMATEYISSFPATPNQIYALKKAGFDVSKGVTQGQAQLAFEKLKNRESAIQNEMKIAKAQAQARSKYGE